GGVETITVNVPILADTQLEGTESLTLTAVLKGQTDSGTEFNIQAERAIDILDIAAVASPTVSLTLEGHVAGEHPLAGTTAVNGGAMDDSGLGFNLDASGNVVAVGKNVLVWGTQAGAVNDFANDILVY